MKFVVTGMPGARRCRMSRSATRNLAHGLVGEALVVQGLGRVADRGGGARRVICSKSA